MAEPTKKDKKKDRAFDWSQQYRRQIALQACFPPPLAKSYPFPLFACVSAATLGAGAGGRGEKDPRVLDWNGAALVTAHSTKAHAFGAYSCMVPILAPCMRWIFAAFAREGDAEGCAQERSSEEKDSLLPTKCSNTSQACGKADGNDTIHSFPTSAGTTWDLLHRKAQKTPSRWLPRSLSDSFSRPAHMLADSFSCRLALQHAACSMVPAPLLTMDVTQHPGVSLQGAHQDVPHREPGHGMLLTMCPHRQGSLCARKRCIPQGSIKAPGGARRRPSRHFNRAEREVQGQRVLDESRQV
jgi:hypothetical protein